MKTMRTFLFAVALAASCGGVETAALDVDGGDGGASRGGTSGSAGAGGSAAGADACAPGTEGCPCYGNDTCDGALSCLSHLCVAAGGRGGGMAGTMGGAGRGGTTGGGNTSGAAGTTGSGGAAGAGNTSGTGNTTGGGGMGNDCIPSCGSPSTCVNGQCRCPGGSLSCNGICCSTGQSCTSGSCVDGV